MFYVLLYVANCVRSSIAIILMGKRELVALLNLSSWCFVMVERLFLAVPQGCLRFVIVVFPRTLLLSFWCGACSISAIGESNGKSQLAKYFQNSYALESYGG